MALTGRRALQAVLGVAVAVAGFWSVRLGSEPAPAPAPSAAPPPDRSPRPRAVPLPAPPKPLLGTVPPLTGSGQVAHLPDTGVAIVEAKLEDIRCTAAEGFSESLDRVLDLYGRADPANRRILLEAAVSLVVSESFSPAPSCGWTTERHAEVEALICAASAEHGSDELRDLIARGGFDCAGP